jgi:hypothetical protein
MQIHKKPVTYDGECWAVGSALSGNIMVFTSGLFSPIIRQNGGVLWSLPDLTWPGAEMYKFHCFFNKKI